MAYYLIFSLLQTPCASRDFLFKLLYRMQIRETSNVFFTIFNCRLIFQALVDISQQGFRAAEGGDEVAVIRSCDFIRHTEHRYD